MGDKMRRKDREVTDIIEISSILDQCMTCHLAMVDNQMPYVIPLSYAYEFENDTLTIFFHSAKEGRKLDILRKNSAVCFEMCMEGEPIHAKDTPCNSGYYYASVHGFGNVVFVEDADEKCHSLSLLMKHQAKMDVKFTKEQANGVCIYKVVTTDFVGKRKNKM